MNIDIDLDELMIGKPKMKNYSLYLEENLVESVKSKTKIPLSKIVNDLLYQVNNSLNIEEKSK